MKVGTIGGIGVYIHWSFWWLIVIYLISATLNSGLAAGLVAVAFVLSLFGCVVLHEFGHAWAAAMFNIRTADITLLPIGGVARLTRLPDRPYQELIIALAGPAVNVVIAGLLLPLVMFGVMVGGSAPVIGSGMDFLAQLLLANIVLVVFNLLPAFPMDGGRVLRSLLAMRTSHLRATEIAARIGRWMALAFGLVGLVYFQIGLILLAGFVYLAGTAELMGARMRAMHGNAPDSYPNQSNWRQSTWQQANWQTRLWPDSGDGPAAAGRAAHGSDRPPPADVIDAIEVRRLPPRD